MIIPTILEKSFDTVAEKYKSVDGVASQIQIDIADGKVVKGQTFLDATLVETLDTTSAIELDLMVENPLAYLEKKLKHVNRVCALLVPTVDPEKFIARAKELEYKVGLSLGPETSPEVLAPYISKIDFVQFMSIIPGGQGRKFLPAVLDKIRVFKTKWPAVEIQVDGGINESNILSVLNAGVNNVVIGSAIVKSKAPKEAFLKFVKLAQMTKQQITTLSDTPWKIQKIAFLGGASWEKGSKTYEDAYATAKLLAENGYEIVDGGGPGVMRAATEGTHDGGGRALAITYHPNKPKKNYEGVDPENHFDEEIITLDYFDRTKVMLQNSDLHIIFNGASGTISEFGMTWASSRIHQGNSKPIILYGEFWNDVLNCLDKNMELRPGERSILKVCNTPKEVLEYTLSLG